MAFSLLFALPGSPVLVYGDEIGMGDDLSLPGREPVRTPMQWSAERNAGFSTADADRLPRAPISEGELSYERVNVAAQLDDPDSLLHWFRRLIRARRLCPEIGWGPWRILESGNESVFAHECEWRGGHVLLVHNLGAAEAGVVLDVSPSVQADVSAILGVAEWRVREDGRFEIDLPPYGYQWIRIRGA